MNLEKLSNAFGVSSGEAAVRQIIIEATQAHADEWHVDTMGNLFITRNHRVETSGPVPRVMVTAHMDEVGFLISEIKSDGLLKFKPIGGFDKRILLGKTLLIGQERVPGVIGLKPIHLLKGDEYKTVGDIDTMYIDVGGTSKGDTKVNVGDLATFATEFGYMGGQTPPPPLSPPDSGGETGGLARQGRVKGKAFDDRVGCAILLELLQGDYPVDLVAVFTVQEELGMRGAKVAAYATNPDMAFILECTAADDLPTNDAEKEVGIPRLGDGPAITVMDNSFIADRPMINGLIAVAEAAHIPYQFKKPGVGGTDAGAIHLARQGIPSAVVSVPARYIHSPAAIIDLADFWHTVDLMRATLTKGFPQK